MIFWLDFVMDSSAPDVVHSYPRSGFWIEFGSPILSALSYLRNSQTLTVRRFVMLILFHLPHRHSMRARCARTRVKNTSRPAGGSYQITQIFRAYRFASRALFILRTASADASNFAFSSSLKLNSTTFSQPFSPTITGTPIQISS